MKVSENILLSSLTTMRLGGNVRYVLDVEAPGEVPEAYEFAALYLMPSVILGGGANTIGHDEGFNGVIIRNAMKGITLDGLKVRAMGGESWDTLVEFACSKGLTGIEAMSKIPGTVGAAPVQNIGAYGQQISDVLDTVEVYDTVEKDFKTLTRDDLKFSYRKSILNSEMRGRYFVIAVTLELRSGEMPRPYYKSIEQYIASHNVTDFSPLSIRKIVSEIRAEKLLDPIQYASAGSFFKNVYLDDASAQNLEAKGFPVHRGKDGNKINAGWLIEKAGFSGKLLYGIRVNEKAALNLINESAESYNNLAAARQEIMNKVYDEFGFWLEQEPVEIV